MFNPYLSLNTIDKKELQAYPKLKPEIISLEDILNQSMIKQGLLEKEDFKKKYEATSKLLEHK